MQNLQSIIQFYSHYFKSLGLDAPRLSAELILVKILDTSRLDILAHPRKTLLDREIKQINREMQRRAQGEPLAYILGQKEFYGYNFHLDPSVLIPRPDTELILDLVQQRFSPGQRLRFADIGTGSGVLGICLAIIYPNSVGVGTEISASALDIAWANMFEHAVGKRFFPLRCDLLAGLKRHKLDLIVANPPYLSQEQYTGLSREIKDHEPQEALLAGKKGTESLDSLFAQITVCLRPGGSFFVEIDSSQGDYVLDCLNRDFAGQYTQIHLYKDLSGQNRVIGAKKL